MTSNQILWSCSRDNLVNAVISHGFSSELAELLAGWRNIPHEAAELSDDAHVAFDKALEGLVGANYVPVALLSTQVVAGMNYCSNHSKSCDHGPYRWKPAAIHHHQSQ